MQLNISGNSVSKNTCTNASFAIALQNILNTIAEYPNSSKKPIVPMIYIIEGEGALVNEKGEEQPLKAGDFALVDPDEKHQYRNKEDKPFKIICGVPKEFEWE